MKRLTTDTPKNNLEAALNLFYIKDHETWVRGYGPAPEYADVSLFDLTRDIVKTHIPDAELPADDDALSNMMPEWLMDGIDSAEGVVALLYTAAWAYAELRHKLMLYEDNCLEPKEVAGLCEMDKRSRMAKMLRWEEAEQTGRLVVLPCGTDAQLIRNGYTFRADHWNHTLTAFRDAPENKSGKQICIFSISEAEAALSKANEIPCKHGLSRHRNEIGEDEVYCELNAKWMNVSLGDCLGNCESEAALAGKGGEGNA